MTAPTFEFRAGAINGHVRPSGHAERVSLIFGLGAEHFTSLSMTATEARAMANALYEAADAAEKVLPLVTAAPVAA